VIWLGTLLVKHSASGVSRALSLSKATGNAAQNRQTAPFDRLRARFGDFTNSFLAAKY
jgi:hypothetical protein